MNMLGIVYKFVLLYVGMVSIDKSCNNHANLPILQHLMLRGDIMAFDRYHKITENCPIVVHFVCLYVC